MGVLVELLGALFRYGRFARSSFLDQLAFLSSAKFAYFLKRSEEVTFVHTETPRISYNRSRTFHQLEPCFGAKGAGLGHTPLFGSF